VAPRRGYRRVSREQPFRRHGTYYVSGEITAPVALTPRAAELHEAGWFTLGALPPECSDTLAVPLANAWLP
jgi:hypothetical protein